MNAAALVEGYNAVILIYFIAMNAMYLALTYHASRAMLSRVRRGRMEGMDDLMRSPLAPGVTIVVPAHNEQECIVESVRSLLALRYQKFDVIVVSDGSTDATVEVLRSAFDLEIFPRVYVPSIPTMPVRKVFRSRTDARLTVVEKANGGKADALNCGINLRRPRADLRDRRRRDPRPGRAAAGLPALSRGARRGGGDGRHRTDRQRLPDRVGPRRAGGAAASPGWPRSRWSSTCARS